MASADSSSVADLLPSFAAAAKYYGRESLPDLPFSFDEEAHALALASELFELQQTLAADDLRVMSEVSSTFRHDMLTSLAAEAARRPLLTFWMLMCAVVPMTLGNSRRQVDVTRTWMLLSTVDNHIPEGTPVPLDPSRFAVFDSFTAGSFYEAAATSAQIKWAASAYWYSWSSGDLDDVAASQLERLTGVSMTGLHEPDKEVVRDSLTALCYIAQWAITENPKASAEASTAIVRVAEDGERSRETRGMAAMSLAMGLAEPAGLDRAAAAQSVLDEYPDLPAGHERFALLTTTARGDADRLTAIIEPLLSAAREHADHVRREAAGIAAMHAESRMFRIAAKAIFPLIRAGEHEAGRKILEAWLDRAGIRSDLTWLLVNDERGAVWASDDKALTLERPIASFDHLVDTMNLALGLRVSNSTGGAGRATHLVADRPSPDAAQGFEAAIAARIGVDEARDILECASDRKEALLLASWMPLPITALTLRDCGVALPVASSLMTPKVDRTLRRAALWTAGVPTGTVEVAAVVEILRDGTIQCDVFDSNLSVDLFKRIYEEDTYDLIWVATHGTAGGIWPEDSRLELDRAHEQRVTFEELQSWSAPDGDRRLVFLNACSMGASAVFGGLAGFGVAAGLAHSSQAIIGYLWPVEDYAAAAFGILLARQLADRNGFFDAFAGALAVRARAGPDLAALLAGQHAAAEPLAQRVGRSNDDFGNLLRWASPVFFE
jgi:CHAT domain